MPQECVAPTMLITEVWQHLGGVAPVFGDVLTVTPSSAPHSAHDSSLASPGLTGTGAQSESPTTAEPELVRLQAETRLRLQVRYPASRTAVISVGGEVDEANRQRLASLVQQRLASLLHVLVLDLSAVSFLSVSAVEIVCQAAHHARTRGIELRLVVTTPGVRRAVRAAAFDQIAACYPRLSQALPDMPAEAADVEQHTPAQPDEPPHGWGKDEA